ncbi:selenocysteine-specific elongation factor [Alteribacillus persepolensis]|uniref:Selenocysteine-specific elongation factor n=1 Tax=Alteribacillus persepolensis TaxID=568899 RepID=A0A1G7YYD1_9BACI|nr:selenocysteine-specific translation elongation factor [Alteribacillus persepolensis]SDH01325.1 selenocysteine-specific elongation factor [Alteribacillus persepolensis]
MTRTYTIGMAGHIDHGKTSLTKALTQIDTDRLKEEKERNISIEPGFAPLYINDDMHVSIIDVPGHEKFIRQMIAGVAGIDAVVLTVAADEGVMPQTKEHLDILSLLDVNGGLIAVTKADKVDNELLQLAGEDIREAVKGTPFEHVDMVYVDSLSGQGVEDVLHKIEEVLKDIPQRNAKGPFRLPIDQVFTVHGQGTVVRGTVYEGSIQEGESVQILPSQQNSKIRQLQIHGEKVKEGTAGQRLAMNLSSIAKENVKRGDVVVSADHYVTTSVIHVVLFTADDFRYALKQRGFVKLHLGTAEVYGRIVFFDRNVLEPGQTNEVVCQLRLDEPVVTKREDRFILRRPTPAETIGGGWVINPNGERLRFGKESIERLQREQQGTPKDHISDALREEKWLTLAELAARTGLIEEEVDKKVRELIDEAVVWELSNEKFVLTETYKQFIEHVTDELNEFHQAHPLRTGKNKEELKAARIGELPKEVTERFLEEAEKKNLIERQKQYVALASFEPHYPAGWEKRMERVQKRWTEDGLSVLPFDDYAKGENLPADLVQELKWYAVETGIAVKMDDKHLWPAVSAERAADELYRAHPTSFTLQQAKDVLNVSRKYLVPFLEWMDEAKKTKRLDQERVWQKKHENR